MTLQYIDQLNKKQAASGQSSNSSDQYAYYDESQREKLQHLIRNLIDQHQHDINQRTTKADVLTSKARTLEHSGTAFDQE